MAEDTAQHEEQAVETTHTDSGQEWGGGVSPYKVSYGKMMMWFLIVSDAFSFAGLLITYAALRVGEEFWPSPADQVFNSFPFVHGVKIPLGFVTLMTFILIMSSVFVVRAVQEGHRMNKTGVLYWMFLGILGGVAFLGCQAWEWNHLIHQGLSLTQNPFGYIMGPDGSIGEAVTWVMNANHELVVPAGTEIAQGHTASLGPRQFGNLFFIITGFHGFHVTTGVLINIIIWIQAARGVYHRRGHYEMLEKVGLYWHFVDLVWVFVFLAFYLF